MLQILLRGEVLHFYFKLMIFSYYFIYINFRRFEFFCYFTAIILCASKKLLKLLCDLTRVRNITILLHYYEGNFFP